MLLLIAVLALIAFFGGAVAGAAFNLFRSDAPSTTERPLPGVVVAMKDLARLEATTFHMERVIDLTESQKRFWGYVEAKDAILLVASGDVVGGIDLAAVGPDDVEIEPEARRVRVTLPQPEVLRVDLDEKRTYVHTRKTDVLAKRQENLEARARQRAEQTIREAALEAGLLDHSRASAEKTIQALLRSMGYTEVEVVWRE